VALATTACLIGGFAPSAAASNRQIPVSVAQGGWQQLADKYYELGDTGYDQQTAAGQNVQAFHVAALAWYAGQKFGWHDPRTKVWLQRVYDREYATGGYGEGVAWDAFGDHTTNPADTTYTITTAWHVGRMLLDGYDHGGVPRAKLVEAARSLLDTTETSGGRCISYSMSVYDENKPCVYNVTAAAALFLTECLKRGIWVPGRLVETATKIARWRDYLLTKYQPALNGWTYADNNNATLDDPGHLAPTSTAAYLLPGAQGYHAVTEYFFHYPTAISTVDMLPFNCDDVDTDYQPQVNYAAGYSDATDPATKVSLGAYAPVEMRVQTLCGKHPTGLWSEQASHHPKPTPIVITPWESLSAAANSVGTSDASTYASGNFDGYGDSFDRAQLATPASTVSYDGVSFRWPNAAPGQPDNVSATGQNIALTGSGSRLGFIGSVAGSFTGTVTVTYTDGTTSQGTVGFGSWANLTKPSQNVVFDTIGNYGRNGFSANGVHYDIFYASIPVDAGKTVTMFTLPTVSQMHFFAVALKQ